MNSSKIIQKAMELISIPSTADNLPALNQAVRLMENFISSNKNITIERFNSNGVPSFLAYAGEARPQKFDVLLNAHVDVVPSPPTGFKPYIKDNKLYGRGAYDMKIAAVILADVFRKLAGCLTINLGLQIVSDEEVGGYNGTYYQLKQGIPKSDFIIAGEMTDLEICNETRGICWADVKFSGKKAHGGYVWEGKNAVLSACEFANELIKELPIPKERVWSTTANVSRIETENNSYNQVPESAVAKIDIRFTPNNKNFANEQAVKDYLFKIYPEIDDIEIKILSPAVSIPTDYKILQQLTRSFAKATGQKAKLIKRYASGDARHFADFDQNFCVEFGPVGNGMHADEEYANLDTLEPYYDTIANFLMDLSDKNISH